MGGIVIRENESLEVALRRFKRKCQFDGILTEIRKREYYETPHLRKKKKTAAAARKVKRRLAQQS